MIRKYNDKFIEQFEEDKYCSYLRTLNHLDRLRYNYNSRYDPSYSTFDERGLLLKESIDHYVLKKMDSEPEFIDTLECKNYFSYLRKLSNENKMDFYTNIVLFNVIKDPKYAHYIQKFSWINEESFIKRRNSDVIGLDKIVKKIQNNKNITQEELDFICGFVSDYRENTSLISNVVKYIFNNLTKPNSNLKASPQVIAAISTYVPYTCKEITKNGFDPTCIRICAANRRNGKYYNGMGTAYTKKFDIILNGNVTKNTNFKSIKSSENPFSFDEYFKNNNYEFTLLLLTLFHEMTHHYQSHIAKMPLSQFFINFEFFVAGYPMAVEEILDNELKDYNENHDNDDIEIHATEIAWLMCHNFYKNVMNDSQLKTELLNRSINNSRGTKNRYYFSVKKDKRGKLIDAVEYDNDNLLQIMKDGSKRNKYFEQFPYLRKIISDSGQFKLSVLFIKNFACTKMGKGIIIKMINTPGIDRKIKQLHSKTDISKDMINFATDNIYVGLCYYKDSLYNIEYYTRKGFKDSFEKNKDLLEVATKLYNSSSQAIANAKSILHGVFSCHSYDSLIENMPNFINQYYDRIINNVKENEKSVTSKHRR